MRLLQRLFLVILLYNVWVNCQTQMVLQSDPKIPVPLDVFDNVRAGFATAIPHKPASLPVQNSTHSFWLHPSEKVNPLAKEGSTGPLTDDADICIIGSGITGISAAYHLSKSDEPLKVVVLEARDFCSGATGRNGGHLTAAICSSFSKRSKSTGGVEEALRHFKLEQRTVDEVKKIIKENDLAGNVDLVETTRIKLHFTEQESIEEKADYEEAKAAGIDLSNVSWLSVKEINETYGTRYPAVQIPGNNLWPLKLVTELYRLAQISFSARINTSDSAYLRLHTNTPVTGITPSLSQNRKWDLHTPRGSINCRVVLHATNGYASTLLPSYIGPKGIIPVRGQVIATRASAPSSEISETGWTGNDDLEYWFPRPVSSSNDHPLVILGGGREIENTYGYYETDDSIINEDVGDALRAFLPAVFPGKYPERQEPEREWTGIMGFTSSGDPFVGPVTNPQLSTSDALDLQGQYISAGYTGHGMPRAYSCAEAVVSLILHELKGQSRETWEIPEWIPRRYLTWIRHGESA